MALAIWAAIVRYPLRPSSEYEANDVGALLDYCDGGSKNRFAGIEDAVIILSFDYICGVVNSISRIS